MKRIHGFAPFRAMVVWLLLVHAAALLCHSAIRLVAYFVLRQSADVSAPVAMAFVNGLWFDNVVACYVAALPAVALLAFAAAGAYPRWLRRAAAVWLVVLHSFTLLVSAANIPYYSYFLKPINSSIFGWFGYARTTVGMVVGEASYLVYAALWLVVSAALGVAVWLSARRLSAVLDRCSGSARGFSPKVLAAKCALTIVVLGLCFVGIRGRLGRSPIRVSSAYYCSDALLNQLGIAPTFNLLNSLKDDMRSDNAELCLMPYAEAIDYTRRAYRIGGVADSAHVMLRHVEADTARHRGQRPNVVVVFMESMSARLMRAFGQSKPLTPTLDSLWTRSLAFSRCYSAGIHTNQGVSATLYSFPALMDRNIMKGTVTPRRMGLPTVLRANGYYNMFFMPHEALYDNMQAYLTTNGFDAIFAQPDYPEEEVVNSFGVSDRYLLSFATDAMTRASATGRPFMAAILTVSNHPPYVIPDYFKPRSAAVEDQIVEYADWSIGQFLSDARRQPWYDNTIFVLVADHGRVVGKADGEVPEALNHIPMIVFGPGVPTMVCSKLATQTDLMPTLLGLMGMDYDYDGFGRDLLSDDNRAIVYTQSDYIVARDTVARYVYHKPTCREMILADDPDAAQSAANDSLKDSLRRHAFAIVQTAEYMYRRDQ